jgi:hypothetical protein
MMLVRVDGAKDYEDASKLPAIIEGAIARMVLENGQDAGRDAKRALAVEIAAALIQREWK